MVPLVVIPLELVVYLLQMGEAVELVLVKMGVMGA